MKNFIETVNVSKFAENDKGQMKQNERNDLRNAFIDALTDALTEMVGFECYRTIEGVGVALPNVEFGSIPVVVGVTVKDLNFDVMDANNEYLEKEMDKVAKAQAKQVEKERRLAEKEANALARKNKNSKK